MSNNIELSIVIPSYLEEENLRIILPRLIKELNKLKVSFEILVIDTMHPMDNTKEVCKENNVCYIKRENGNYYGDAVRTGIKYSSGRYTIFMDADGSHSPEFIKYMYTLRDEYDIVIASRYVKGGGSDNTRILIFMSLMVNIIFSWFLALKLKDVSNSFKLYKTNLLKEINLSYKNFDVVEEILVRLKRKNKNLKVKEIPYFFKERMFGHTKRNLIAFVFSYAVTLIKLSLVRNN